jgi:hypothetical protein
MENLLLPLISSQIKQRRFKVLSMLVSVANYQVERVIELNTLGDPMEQLKQSLGNLEWIFPILYPAVKSKFCSVFGVGPELVKDVSMTYLTARYYRSKHAKCTLPIKKPTTSLMPLLIDSEPGSYMAGQTNLLFEGCQLLATDQLPSFILDWSNVFREFCSRNVQYKCVDDFLEYTFFLRGVPFRGASHPHFLGSVFHCFRPNDSIFDFLVSLVHESAHQELFLINFIDRLINEEYDFNLIHAPYQNKERPPIGRLHSLHALFRMIQFAKIYDEKNERVPFLVSKFRQNLYSFEQNELTHFGSFLRGEVYEPFLHQI